MNTIKLSDELCLEPLDGKHAPTLFKLIADERTRLAEWLRWPGFIQSIEDYRGFIERCRTERDKGESDVYSIQWHGNPVGTTGFINLLQELRKGEIGYWISASVEGKGIATATMKALCQLGADRGFTKIEASVATGNSKSMAVCERAGLQIEATIAQDECLNDKILDHHKYARFY